MTGLALMFFALSIAVFAFALGYGTGHANGFAKAMRENGWHKVTSIWGHHATGWHKETPTKPPPNQPALRDYVDPSDFE